MQQQPISNIPRLAILIDAENARAAHASKIMDIVSTHGDAVIRRAYGDWTTTQLTPWKKVLEEHALIPAQQFRHARNKNASDCALIMYAMDLIHTRVVDGICIASSDSDYTGVAIRIREAGLSVYGLGLRNTPRAFVAACDEFAWLDEVTS